MWFNRRKPVTDPLALARQVRRMDEIRERSQRQVKVLRQQRWYHTAAIFGLLLAPLAQYIGYLSTFDMRWYYYPLAAGVIGWAAVNIVAPAAAPVSLPLSWAKVAFVAGTAWLLIMLASVPSDGTVVAYRAIACDLIIIITATSLVNCLNFARFGGS